MRANKPGISASLACGFRRPRRKHLLMPLLTFLVTCHLPWFEFHDVYLNESACWRDIPAPVWDFTIGGYQVIKKWLSYREFALLGRALTPDEAREVSRHGPPHRRADSPQAGAGQKLSNGKTLCHLTLKREGWFFAVFSGMKIACSPIILESLLPNPKGIASLSPGLARFTEGLPRVAAIKMHNPEGVEYKAFTTQRRQSRIITYSVSILRLSLFVFGIRSIFCILFRQWRSRRTNRTIARRE